MMARAPASSLGKRVGGTVAIEYAFVLPVLLLFVLGIVDCGRLIWSYTTLNRSVQAAARCAAVNAVTCATAAQVQTYAVSQAFGMQVTPAAFTLTAPACGKQVTASLSFVFIIPWFGIVQPYGPSNSTTLHATACYPPSH